MPFNPIRFDVTLLALVMLLLIGCTSDVSLSQDARFDVGAASGNSGSGLILVGMRVAREPVGHSWLLGDISYNPTYFIEFADISEDGKLGRVRRQVRICELTRDLSNGAFSDCRPSRMQYKLISVPPGRYSLKSMSYQAGRNTITSSFVDPRPARGPFVFSPIGPGGRVRDPSKTFVVNAGEIVYAGDLNFYFIPQVMNPRLAVSRNDAAARASLATYPNVHGEMVYRPQAAE